MPDPDVALAEILNPELSSWLAAVDAQAEAGPLVPALAAARDEIAAAVHGADALARWRANGEAT